MTRSTFASSAIASALLVLSPALLASRPHYGGVLVMQSESVVGALDPASADADADAARAHVVPLVFESLVRVDGAGGVRPSLAVGWEHDGRFAHWRFALRPRVVLHDGSLLDTVRTASALGARERTWRVNADGDGITIDLERPNPDLPWVLADTPHAIVSRTPSGALIGSGPFMIDRVGPAEILLKAHEDYWAGRPFLDGIRIDQGRPLREQLTALEAGRIDVASIAPTDFRRVTGRGLRTAASLPLTLYVLAFEPHRGQSADDGLRAAVAASIDRPALASVVLQRQAEPADALLPAWISGYTALLRRGRPAPSQGHAARRTIVLRIDLGDPLARTIADRIGVDAREHGVDVVVQAPNGLAPRPDARLVRVPLRPTTPDRALAGLMQALGSRTISMVTPEGPPPAGAPLPVVLDRERALLRDDILLPLVHVAEVWALGDRVESWNDPPIAPSGGWNFASVWLREDARSLR
jgi:extracellular solute-binding protein (family 5)